ncbi:MAG TPA: SPOR domain-containing protein [Steroidobacteraceae bacterium]|nr:SPOR domain-containing protein [Steroidobacteraceae bacterium]
MDRRVKERLIGASILVALIVLVVPELLSGPKSAVPPATLPTTFPANAPEPTRNVTLDLATSKAPANSEVEPAETQGSAASAVSAVKGGEPSPAAPAPPTEGSPTVGAPTTAAPAAGAPTTAAPAADAPTTLKPVETAAQSPISARANWAVQLGSFASRANADNLSRQLKGQGFSVYVLPGGSSTTVRYRVRVGPLADRDSAERMAAKLKSIGHASSLVAPAG